MAPGDDSASGIDAGLCFDQRGRAGIRPNELLGTGPFDADRLAAGFGEAGGFDFDVGALLAAESATGRIGDDADVRLLHAHRFGDFGAHDKGGLLAAANGEAAILGEAGYGGAGFEGGVGDGGEGEAERFRLRSGGEGLGGVAATNERRVSGLVVLDWGFRIGLEGGDHLVESGQGFVRPFGLGLGGEGAGFGERRGADAGEIAFADDALARGGDEFRTVFSGTQDDAVPHAVDNDVAVALERASDDVAAVQVWLGLAQDGPVFRLAEGRAAQGGGVFSDCRDGFGGGERGPGATVVGGEVGVAHDQTDLFNGNAEFVGDTLGEQRAQALAHVDLAGEGVDFAVGGAADVESGFGALERDREGERCAGSEDLEEFAALVFDEQREISHGASPRRRRGRPGRCAAENRNGRDGLRWRV